MSEFILKRVSASWAMLKPEEVEPFRAIREYANAMGKGRLLTETVIVNLIMDFGCEKADDLVKRFAGRGFFTLDRLQGLIEGSEPRTFQRPPHANEMPGRDRSRSANAPMPVSAFLAQHSEQIAKPDPRKLPEGWMTRETMLKWMAENHPDDLDLADEFFEYLGIEKTYGPCYRLKTRILQ